MICTVTCKSETRGYTSIMKGVRFPAMDGHILVAEWVGDGVVLARRGEGDSSPE